MLGALRRHMTLTRAWLSVVMVLCVSVLVWDTVRSYLDHRSQTVERLTALGKVVEARTQLTFQSLDLLLREVADQAPADDLPPGDQAYFHFLKSRSFIFTDALTVSIVSKDGIMLHATRPELVGVKVGERSYLTHFRDHPEDDLLFISEPAVSVAKRPVVFVARAIRGKDGALRAVAVTAISPDLFESLLKPALPSEAGGAVAVLNKQGIILSRTPDPQPSALGASLADSPLFPAHKDSGKAVSVQSGSGGPDGENRLVVIRSTEEFNLIVAVTIKQGELLQPAISTAAADMVFLIIVGAVTIVLGRFLGAHEKRRSEAQQQIAAARDYYMRLLDNLPIHIWRSNALGKLDYVNAALQNFLGDHPGDDLTRFIHPADLDAAADAAKLRLSRRQAGELEYRLRRSDGEHRWMHEAVQPFLDPDGAFAGHLGACLDVTDTRESQDKLTRSNAELEQFAYVASHDLREPLRMINSYLGLIERRLPADSTAEISEFLAFARDGAARMDKLILDLLQYSRIGRMSAPRTETDLNNSMTIALMNLHAALEDSNAQICIGALPIVMASGDDMVRLFQNLIGNALKYCRDDVPPRITIESFRDAGAWRIMVSDNGIGLDHSDFDRIFRIFQRLHARREHGGGSGIGLSICKKIVENHQGRIWVDSPGPGQGASFSFTLPA